MIAAMQALQDAGLTAELTDTGGLLVRPASCITEDLRGLIRAHREEVVRYLTEQAANDDALQTDLLAAAMRACDHHGDGDKAREAMRQDVLATPPHLRADLLRHFTEAYP